MNKKGFVLMETLVVTIFTLFIFTILYNSVVPLLGKYEELSYYNDLDITYDLYHLSKFIKSDDNYDNIKNYNYKKLTCENGTINDTSRCENLFNLLDIDTDDELIFLNTNYKNELINDSNVSNDIKDYLEYIDVDGNILLLQNDGYLSYLKLMTFFDKINNSIKMSTCNPIVEEDGIIYFSGTDDCVNFNYVWYSGKLWRITAIYPDGTMKMITQDAITAITYGEDYNFYTDESTSSWIYQWLNEDFLDTLYNYENIIVTDSTWNVTSGDGTISTKLSETTMVNAKVGLLNSYEYYMSYKNLGSYSKGYLNILYSWWLSNLYSTSSSYVWRVLSDGSSTGIRTPSYSAYGGRPVVNLKSTIQLAEGTGIKSDPYRIKGDKEDAVQNISLLNTRSSGEYVNFDGELYRIVGIENNTTKLNKVDYVRDTSNTVLNKKIASTVTFGLSTNTQSEDYWDYYLNNTWYNNISSNYKSMLEKGTYYLGIVNSPYNYKKAICASASNTTRTKDCTKTSRTYTGYVGLPRYGEMFATQLGSGYSPSSTMWLITLYDASYIWRVSDRGEGGYNTPSSYTYGGRPSINLSSSVKIIGGTGLPDDPFEISL